MEVHQQVKEKEVMYKRYREESDAVRMVHLTYNCVPALPCLSSIALCTNESTF